MDAKDYEKTKRAMDDLLKMQGASPASANGTDKDKKKKKRKKKKKTAEATQI